MVAVINKEVLSLITRGESRIANAFRSAVVTNWQLWSYKARFLTVVAARDDEDNVSPPPQSSSLKPRAQV